MASGLGETLIGTLEVPGSQIPYKTIAHNTARSPKPDGTAKNVDS